MSARKRVAPHGMITLRLCRPLKEAMNVIALKMKDRVGHVSVNQALAAILSDAVLADPDAKEVYDKTKEAEGPGFEEYDCACCHANCPGRK